MYYLYIFHLNIYIEEVVILRPSIYILYNNLVNNQNLNLKLNDYIKVLFNRF